MLVILIFYNNPLYIEKYNILVLDTYNLGGFNPFNDSFDGCHPTELYYANKLAPIISQFIKDNYKK